MIDQGSWDYEESALDSNMCVNWIKKNSLTGH